MIASLDIRVLRAQLGWTQQQMADYLGVDRSSVSRMERGQIPHGSALKLLEHLTTRVRSNKDRAA